MNLATTITLWFGGMGSGCRGANCGRKNSGRDKDINEVLKFHDFIKEHPFRGGADERQAKFQNMHLRSLAEKVESLAKKHKLLDDFTKNSLKASVQRLDEAEGLMAKESYGLATGKQDAALNTLHFLLESFRSSE
jgi:hypothetical protein